MNRHLTIDKSLFVHNRAKVRAAMARHSVAVVCSNDVLQVHGDDTYPFVQNSDFFYLTGIEQDRCVLLLYKGESDSVYEECLLIDASEPQQEVWVGRRLSIEEAHSKTGIHSIQYNNCFCTKLNELVKKSSIYYINNGSNIQSKVNIYIKSVLESNIFHQKKHLSSVMTQARSVKSEIEIRQIKAACQITVEGFREVLPYIKPGVMEFELEASLAKSFISRRSKGFAFAPIIASGNRACTLHYTNNNQACAAGDLILFDVGAEYAHYRADVTRVFPVSGRFTSRQKEVYEAVLRIMQYAEGQLVCGNTLSTYHRSVGKQIERELLTLGLITEADIKKQTPEQPAYRRFCMHSISHHLGLDTHDVCPREGLLKPGMVLTIEPGIYIPDEGIGIRLENDYVLHAEGLENLTSDIPIHIEQIEAAVQNQTY